MKFYKIAEGKNLKKLSGEFYKLADGRLLHAVNNEIKTILKENEWAQELEPTPRTRTDSKKST